MSNYLPVFFSFLSFSLFSIMNATNKYVLTNTLVDPYIYFSGIGIFQFFWVVLIGYSLYKSQFFIVKSKKIVICRAFVLVINVASTTFSVKYLPLDVFYSIVFIMPLLATLLAWIFLKESISLKNIIAIVLGFIGTLIVINPAFSNKFEITGVLLSLLASITGVISAIVGRKYLKQENPFSVSLYTAVFVGTAGLAINILPMFNVFNTESTITKGFAEIVDKISLTHNLGLALLFLSSFCSIMASILYLKAYQKGEVKYVAPVQYIQIIWGVGFGYFLFADVPQTTTIIGVFVIILANIINNKSKNKPNLQ